MTTELLTTLYNLIIPAEEAALDALDSALERTPDAQWTAKSLQALRQIVTALDTPDPYLRRTAMHNAIANLEYAMRVMPQPPSLYSR